MGASPTTTATTAITLHLVLAVRVAVSISVMSVFANMGPQAIACGTQTANIGRAFVTKGTSWVTLSCNLGPMIHVVAALSALIAKRTGLALNALGIAWFVVVWCQ